MAVFYAFSSVFLLSLPCFFRLTASCGANPLLHLLKGLLPLAIWTHDTLLLSI